MDSILFQSEPEITVVELDTACSQLFTIPALINMTFPFRAEGCARNHNPSRSSRCYLARCIHERPVEPIIRGTDPSQACAGVKPHRVIRYGTHVLKVQALLGLGCNKSDPPVGHDVPLLRGGAGRAGHKVDPGHVFPVTYKRGEVVSRRYVTGPAAIESKWTQGGTHSGLLHRDRVWCLVRR